MKGDVAEANLYTLSHEMVHAVYQSVCSMISPALWFEGRAEYIGYKACSRPIAERCREDCDRSLQSDAEKADFFQLLR